ncbi:MAG: S8 family serine peptidase [Sphingobium sp.]|nr:S8 family serine peptidase [Sphingobium sp.]
MIPALLRCCALLLALIGTGPAAHAALEDTAPERQIMVMLNMPPAHLRTGSGYAGGYGEDASRGARLRAAGRIARAHGLALVENWPMPSLGIECFIMRVPGSIPVEQAVSDIEMDPAVAWSEPVALYKGQAGGPANGRNSHDDPLFAAQPGAKLWPLAALHHSLTGRNVTVAVIDSGVDPKQPDLAGQIALDRNFVPGANAAETHGTAVAGIIAARADNHVGIAGIAPDARILALRACSQGRAGTLCDSFSLAKAIQFAVERKSPIINLSLSGPPGKLLSVLLKQGLDKGATIVAAYDPQLPDGGFPASLPGVIAVSDKNATGRATLVYYAPGQDIPAPAPGGQWTLVNGSSFSAAHVSGLLALLRQQRRSNAPLVATTSNSSTIDICATFGNATCGGGLAHAQ